MRYRDCTILQCGPTELPGCWYIEAGGYLDIGPPLDAFTARVKQAIADGARWMIFDCRKIVSYVDCGHGALVQLSDALQGAGGGAILLAMDARNRMVFQMLKLEHFFHFAQDFDEALTIARGNPGP
jgi:anti-anti-sigma regulatory factor